MSGQFPAISLDVLMPGCFDAPCARTKVTGLSSDSRNVERGDLFFALDGYSRRGSEFALDAVRAGAVAVASNDPLIGDMPLHVPLCFDEGLGQKTSTIAGIFYGNPSETMDVIGITGTNGKTSCCFWLSWLLARVGVQVGQIGTLGAGMGGASIGQNLNPTGFTTPDALQSQKLLAEYKQAGAEAAVMEVSSQGLDQGRVAAVRFESAIFTNLSRDHLDYHGNRGDYLAAKLKLFARPELKRAIVNLDDRSSASIAPVLPRGVEHYSYGLTDTDADIFFSEIQPDSSGFRVSLDGRWGEAGLLIPVCGEYNLSNLLAVCAAALARGIGFGNVVEFLESAPAVPGRMQQLALPSAPRVVVDYAHTPDAVESVLKALRPQVAGRLITVLGCGGNRDSDKRSPMAIAAVRHSDKQVFTSDNPRHEAPLEILHDMLGGLGEPDSKRVGVIEDRREAIEAALEQAGENDLVAVLGKGHENYQLIRGRKIAFNDAEVCQQILATLAGERAAT